MLLAYLKRKAAGHTYRCSDGPDMSGVAAAAQANADLGKEALAFYKQAYADQAPARDQAAANANAISQSQLGLMNASLAQSNAYQQDRDTLYRPLEQGIVAGAQNYDTAARRESEATAAAADVQKAGAAQQAALQRQQSSMGVNPNSGRAQALQSQQSLGMATATAGAMNAARKNVEQQGYARKMDAANLGRGIASNQATSANIALNAGNSSASNGAMGLQAAQSGSATMGQGFNSALSANQSAGNLYGQAAQLQAGASANNMAGLGQLAGLGLGAYQAGMFSSSKKLKHQKRPMSEEQALDGIKGLKVEQWDYKPGVADGGTHIGPYAEDVRRGLGDAVAPGGKMLDAREMSRANTMAIQALTKRAAMLERELQRLEA
jgi:hypothetical protein